MSRQQSTGKHRNSGGHLVKRRTMKVVALILWAAYFYYLSIKFEIIYAIKLLTAPTKMFFIISI